MFHCGDREVAAICCSMPIPPQHSNTQCCSEANVLRSSLRISFLLAISNTIPMPDTEPPEWMPNYTLIQVLANFRVMAKDTLCQSSELSAKTAVPIIRMDAVRNGIDASALSETIRFSTEVRSRIGKPKRARANALNDDERAWRDRWTSAA